MDGDGRGTHGRINDDFHGYHDGSAHISTVARELFEFIARVLGTRMYRHFTEHLPADGGSTSKNHEAGYYEYSQPKNHISRTMLSGD